MQAHEIVSRIMAAAAVEKNDAESNRLSALANRLAHQGSLFETKLTRAEVAAISKFMR
jgi:hypothetical protein